MASDSAIDVLNKRLSPEITYTQKIENDSSGRPIFIGLAKPGTATSKALWQIRKITYDGSGFLTDVQWAGGNATFNQVWDDRAGLSYS